MDLIIKKKSSRVLNLKVFLHNRNYNRPVTGDRKRKIKHLLQYLFIFTLDIDTLPNGGAKGPLVELLTLRALHNNCF